MHEDELGRRIAELVADNTDRATPPPVAAIHRRGRRRHARLASGAMLLIAAMAAGLIAVQGPLRRQVTPVPVVTQPPRPIQPTSSFAAYVRGKFQDKVVDMTIVVLASGKTGGYHWQLAAVHGTSRLTHKAKVCLVHQADGASHPYGYECRDRDSNRAGDKITFASGTKELPLPLWGMVPEGTARVRLLRSGRPPIEVDAVDSGLDSGDASTSSVGPWTSERWWPWMRRAARSPASPLFPDLEPVHARQEWVAASRTCN
jgi:hypothetical protein